MMLLVLLLAFAAPAQEPRTPVITGNADIFAMVNADGTVSTWGIAGDAGFGDGRSSRTASREKPTPVAGITTAVQVAVGERHVLVLLADGSVVGWGANNECQVGNGDPTRTLLREDRLPPVYSPVRVTGLRNVKAVAAGDAFSVALLNDGTLMTWGQPRSGRLGFGPIGGPYDNMPCVPVPKAVPGVSRVKAIAATYDHTLAVLEDGTAIAFGVNTAGQLGDGTREPRATPVSVRGVANAVAVAAGSEISVALLADGAVWTWGSTVNGQAGDRNPPPTSADGAANANRKLTPGPVAGLPGAKAIAAGLGFVMVQLKDGTLRGWGQGNYGELGNNSGSGWYPKPETPIGLGPVAAYSVVVRAGFAWKADGTLMAWGVAIVQPDGRRGHSNVPVRLWAN